MHTLILATLLAIGYAGDAYEHTHRNKGGRTSRHPLTDEADPGSDDNDSPGRNFQPVPIVKDCVGDMRAEAKECICRKQYGFRKSVCGAGQQCYRPDGICLNLQEVTCKYEGQVDSSELAAYYMTGDEEDAVAILERSRVRDPVTGEPTTSVLARDAFEFSFTDQGPDYNVVIDFQGDCTSFDGMMAGLVCDTASGPWKAYNGISDRTMNSSAESSDASGGRDDDSAILAELEGNRKRGRWTGVPGEPGALKVACADREWTARSYSPYRENNAQTCMAIGYQADSAGESSEVSCGAMRASGIDCCYSNGKCGFDRRCNYSGGLFVLNDNEWETQMFGTPERNHLADLADRLIAGRANTAKGEKVVQMEHTH